VYEGLLKYNDSKV